MPVISQGIVGGMADINIDYSSMTDSFGGAFWDLPSDLGQASFQQGTL